MVNITTDAALKSTITVSVPYIKLKYRQKAKQIREAIQLAMRETVRKAEIWKTKYFPARTGALLGSSTVSMFFEPDLAGVKRKFIIELKSGNARVNYASYVNRMTGVNWTNPQTVEHYFDEWVKFVKKTLVEHLNLYVRPLTV